MKKFSREQEKKLLLRMFLDKTYLSVLYLCLIVTSLHFLTQLYNHSYLYP